MATLKEIEESIKSIESKKQSLKEAFENLQNHSQALSSFTLSWQEIDAHFSNIQSSLQARFSTLQKKEQSLPNSKQIPENPFPQNLETKSMCEKMEASKLRNWVITTIKVQEVDLSELGWALKWAPDPFKLVLDAIEGVQPKGKSCVVLLEGLMMVEGASASVSKEVRERAKNLAVKWKGEVNEEGKYQYEIVGLLFLLVCFGLVGDFGKDEVLELVYIGAKNAKMKKACRVLGLEKDVPDLVQKLIGEGKQLLAIKFAFEFKLLEKFPPEQLLNSYLKIAKKAAQKIRKKGKNSPMSLGQADLKEFNALKTVLKYIGDYNLASKFPPETIEMRIKQLEYKKANRKSTIAVQPQKAKQQKRKAQTQPLQKSSKRPVTHANSYPTTVPGIANGVGLNLLPPSQQPYLLPPVMSGELPDLASSIGPYAISGAVPNAPYGLPGSLLSYASYPNPVGSLLHALGSQLPSSSYSGPNL